MCSNIQVVILCLISCVWLMFDWKAVFCFYRTYSVRAVGLVVSLKHPPYCVHPPWPSTHACHEPCVICRATNMLWLLLLWSSNLDFLFKKILNSVVNLYFWPYFSISLPLPLLLPLLSVSFSSCLHVWSSWTPMDHDIAIHTNSSLCLCFYYSFSFLLPVLWLSLPLPTWKHFYLWTVAVRWPQLPLVADVLPTAWQLFCCPCWLRSGSHKLILFKEKEDSLSLWNPLLSMPFWPLCSHTQDEKKTRKKKNKESRHWFHDVITGCSALASFSYFGDLDSVDIFVFIGFHVVYE